jgi:protein SCO1/2
MMKSRSLIFLGLGGLFGILAVVLAAALFSGPYEYQGSVINPPIPAMDFTLMDEGGSPFNLSAQGGNVVLLFFGYTSCPDVCPTTLAEYKQIHASLGDQAEYVRFVFVTVDPERDTKELVGEYVSRFNPNFIGLSGSEAELQPVWDGFFVFRGIEPHEPGEHYLVDHTARIYAVDVDGNLRLTFPFGMGVDAISEDVRQLLKES